MTEILMYGLKQELGKRYTNRTIAIVRRVRFD